MYIMENLTTLYVDGSNGLDTNQGVFPYDDATHRGPLKTIEAALKKIADMRMFGACQPVTIRVCGEEYIVKKPIVIDSSVSSVTIEPQNKCLISGGIKISGFEPDEFNGKKCVSVKLDADISFTDFYVSGKAARRTRYPEEGYLLPERVENEGEELFDCSKWFIVKNSDFEIIKNFRNLKDCLLSYNHYWVDEHTPIEEIDGQTRKITMKYLSCFTVSNALEKSRMEYYLENVAETFKNENEWYYDSCSHKLFYIPEDETPASDIEGYIPIADKLFCIRGKEDSKVRNVCIRNFELAYTRGEYRSENRENQCVHERVCDGFASDVQAVCDAHGGIEFENAYHCSVENCKIFCFGVHGIKISDGSSGIHIEGNTITQTGAGAITVNGGAFGSEACTHTHSNIIADNEISYCGNRYFAACGILLRHSYENIVSHNTISDCYYSGISCGWVWGYADSISHDNLIEKNHIFNIGKGKLSDMGGIYLLGRQPGTVLRGNLIHDVKSCHYGGWAIYTDEGSSGVLIENNISYNTSSNSFHQHYGCRNTVRNNIFAFSEDEPLAQSMPEMHTGVIFERNIILTSNKPIFRVGYEEADNGASNVISSNNNIVYDVSGNKVCAMVCGNRRYTMQELREELSVDMGSIEADPMFVDYESFKPDINSPAYKIGFKNIDMDDVGARKTHTPR